MPMAVNCLVMDPILKMVSGVIEIGSSKLAIPYPEEKMGL